MITKNYRDMYLPDKESGFFITGNSREDLYNQLKLWCYDNKDKWVYIYEFQVKDDLTDSTIEWCLEVCFYDKKPSRLMFMYILYQEGSEGLKEEATLRQRFKQLEFLYFFSHLLAKFNKK